MTVGDDEEDPFFIPGTEKLRREFGGTHGIKVYHGEDSAVGIVHDQPDHGRSRFRLAQDGVVTAQQDRAAAFPGDRIQHVVIEFRCMKEMMLHFQSQLLNSVFDTGNGDPGQIPVLSL